MGRGGRSGNEGFNPAEAWGNEGDCRSPDKVLSRFNTAYEFKAEHTAVPIEESPGSLVAKMAFETRIVYLFDRRMSFQKPGDFEGAFVLVVYPYRKCLQAAMEKETGVGIEGAAEVVELVRDFFDQISSSNDSPGHDIGVAVEVFCAAMEGKVEAPFGRPKIHGARKGVIDHRNKPVARSEFDHCLQIPNLKKRVRHCFNIYGLGAGSQITLP